METICFNQTCVGIVVFSRIDELLTPASHVIIITITAFELFFILILLTVLSLSAKIIWKSSIFHPNMMRMAMFLIIHIYYYIITRLILLLYQMRLLRPSDQNIDFAGVVVIIASTWRVYTAFAIVFAFFAFIIERLFASIYCRDYEFNHRSWLAFTELFIVVVLSFIGACDITFSLFKLPGFTAPIVLLLITLSAGSMALVLYAHNRKRLAALIDMSYCYTLAERYQLDENLRAFKFLLVIAVTATACAGSCFSIMIYRIFNNDDRVISAVSGAAFDCCLAIAFTVWQTIIILKQPVWREQFTLVLISVTCLPRKPLTRVTPVDRRSQIGADGDLYFRHLNGAWDTQYKKRIVDGIALFSDAIKYNLSTSMSIILTVLTIIEFLFLMFLFCAQCFVVGIIRKSAVFHANMIRMALFFIFNLHLWIISRIAMYFYQARIIDVSDKVPDIWSTIIISISVVRMYSAFAINASLLTLVIERLFATLLIHDYESCDRKLIAVFCISSTILFGIACALESLLGLFKLPGITTIVLALGVCVVSGALIIALYFHNKRLLRQVLNGIHPYYLSERYQIDENIRAFEYILKIAVSGAIVMAFNVSIMLFRFIYRKDKVIWVICGAAFDTSVAITISLWGAIVFTQQPVWREEFLQKFSRLLKRPRALKSRVHAISEKDAAEIYFRELSINWEERFESK